MTEINGETSKDFDVENNEYLYESYLTEDGIEVPPPTRPMGPRRLTRYREDAAAYLRAIRDGAELPAEPVAYMPPSADEQGLSEEEIEVQRKFAALAAMGDIQGPDAEDDILIAGTDTRDDVAVVDSAAVPAAQPTSNDITWNPPADDASISIHYGGDIIVEEDEEFAESDEIEEQPAEVLSNELESEGKTSEPEEELGEEELLLDKAEEHIEVQLPQPVSALSAQGLDLSRIVEETVEEEAEEEENLPASTELIEEPPTVEEPDFAQTPWNTAAQKIVPPADEQVEETQSEDEQVEAEQVEAQPRDVLASSFTGETIRRDETEATSLGDEELSGGDSAESSVELNKNEDSSPAESSSNIWWILILIVALIAIALFLLL